MLIWVFSSKGYRRLDDKQSIFNLFLQMQHMTVPQCRQPYLPDLILTGAKKLF